MSENKFPNGVMKPTELLAEKHNFLAGKKIEPENFCKCADVKRESPWNIRVEHFSNGSSANLIPFRRAIKVNLDDLPGIGDVVPVPVGLPAFRNNLD